MPETVIKAEKLGKKYLLGRQQPARYQALRDVLTQGIRHTVTQTGRWLRREPLVRGESTEAFWALQDLDFEVQQGDRVGIIGRNGAGKSTLLKILSRITEPSAGRVEISGRVASLLEVGTGFHPELTGRENIFLNGAIMGMSRAEIRRKFEEMVDFAGVERFLDTPVKRYSTGMYTRLAFSVAAHLEPDILIVDEVLAVGDAEFQRKCLGKMEDVSKKEGRTVLFVSHQMDVIRQLCNRAFLLASGRIVEAGGASEVIVQYLNKHQTISNTLYGKHLNNDVVLETLSIQPGIVQSLSQIDYQISLRFPSIVSVTGMALLIYNQMQQRVGIIDLRSAEGSLNGNRLHIEGTIFSLTLVEGIYTAGLYLNCNWITGDFLDLVAFEVIGVPSDIIPYPVQVRGTVEFNHIFTNK